MENSSQANFAIAIKAFIVNNGQVLLIKRPENALHKPGVWEIPGGRLSEGENPFEGLKREVKEEVNLDIEVVMPLRVHHFVRGDGQKITMIVFYCKSLGNEIKISHEHTQIKWIPLEEAKYIITPDFLEEIKLYQKWFQK